MPISANFKSKHTKSWDIYFSQCYPNAALKISDLANLLQLTASEHADLGGLGFEDLGFYDQSWVMNRMRIEISALPKWGDQIAIQTWVEGFKGVKSSRNFSVEVDGKVCIGVSSLWVIFNTKTRRPDTMKLDYSHFEMYPELHATEIAHQKIDVAFEADKIDSLKVQFSDLDIVNHVNNTKYLEWCLNCIDPSIILSNKIKAIDLNFARELAFQDEVKIHQKTLNDRIVFKIMKDEVLSFSCVLELRD